MIRPLYSDITLNKQLPWIVFAFHIQMRWTLLHIFSFDDILISPDAIVCPGDNCSKCSLLPPLSTMILDDEKEAGHALK